MRIHILRSSNLRRVTQVRWLLIWHEKFKGLVHSLKYEGFITIANFTGEDWDYVFLYIFVLSTIEFD